MLATLVQKWMKIQFLSSTVKKVGSHVVANLPVPKLPTKPKFSEEEEERMPKDVLYDLINYQKKERLPHCRYFSLEHKNRIYHVYNAYYYPMGRMINNIATAIRGRNSPHYKNNVADIKNGDICVIVNIEDPLFTGKKLLWKTLRYHTGFIGHLRSFTYREVLNKKPELLYYYLLRKAMPKNKIAPKYMENVVLVRGHTHNFSFLPQFAPDKKIYELLPEVNLLEVMKNDPKFKVTRQSEPGLAEKILNRKVERNMTEKDKIQEERQQEYNLENNQKLHEEFKQVKMVPDISRKKYEVLKRKEKRIEGRYKRLHAPYKIKNDQNPGMELFLSEKKARKHPDYAILADDDQEEEEEQHKGENPHLPDGGIFTNDTFKD